MAITYRTVTGNLADLLRSDFDPGSVRITVRTNLDPGDAPIDLTNGQILLGTGRVTVASDGTFSTTNVIDHASTNVNPTGIQYRWDIDYTPRNGQRIASWSSGFVNVTADADLATLVATQYVPPSYQSAFIEQAEGYLARQEQIAGLADSDAAQAYNVDHGPLTRGALEATIGDTVNTLVPTASTTAQGKVELATTGETITGTDAGRATTPAGIAAATVPRPAGGTTAGYVPTVQSDGSIAYAAVPGAGGTAVGAADL